jgi:hypothetical protein
MPGPSIRASIPNAKPMPRFGAVASVTVAPLERLGILPPPRIFRPDDSHGIRRLRRRCDGSRDRARLKQACLFSHDLLSATGLASTSAGDDLPWRSILRRGRECTAPAAGRDARSQPRLSSRNADGNHQTNPRARQTLALPSRGVLARPADRHLLIELRPWPAPAPEEVNDQAGGQDDVCRRGWPCITAGRPAARVRGRARISATGLGRAPDASINRESMTMIKHQSSLRCNAAMDDFPLLRVELRPLDGINPTSGRCAPSSSNLGQIRRIADASAARLWRISGAWVAHHDASVTHAAHMVCLSLGRFGSKLAQRQPWRSATAPCRSAHRL